MTRLLKMSLSLVVVLLVAVLVLTSCNNDELKAELDASIADAEAAAKAEADKAKADAAQAQAAADEAKAAAEKNLAEAKKALAEATASLQAALANKADTATLTAEIAKLTEAVEKANAAAAAANAELAETLKELEKAIEDAKDTADGALTDEELVALRTLAATEAWNLDRRLDEVKAYVGLYTANAWTNIQKAYNQSKVDIYRAVSAAAITTAKADFEAALAANPNALDTLKTDIDEFDGDVAAAKLLFEGAHAIRTGANDAIVGKDEAKNTILAYYGKDLYAAAMNTYVATLENELTTLSALYLVYPEETTIGAGEADAIKAAREAIAAIEAVDNTETADVNENGPIALYNANKKAETADVALSTTVKEGFAKQEAALAILEKGVLTVPAGVTVPTDGGAKNYADAINTWKGGINTDTFVAELTSASVTTLNTWNKAIADWDAMFNSKEAQDKDAARKALNDKLIETAKADIAPYIETLAGLATQYKADAFEWFQVGISQFYDLPVDPEDETTYSNMVSGTYDKTKVTLVSGTAIKAIQEGLGEWLETYPLNLDLTYATTEKKPSESQNEFATIKSDYTTLVNTASTAWAALATKYTAITAEGYADTMTIYNEDVYAVYDWFDKYLVMVDTDEDGTADTIVWDKVVVTEGEEPVNAYILNNDVVVTEAQYTAVKALKDALDAKVKAAADAAKALNDRIAAIADTAWSDRTEAASIKADIATFKTTHGYKDNNALNAVDARNFLVNETALDAVLTNLYGDDKAPEATAGAGTDGLEGLLNALNKVTTEFNTMLDGLNTTIPHFNATVARADFEAKLTALKNAKKAFTDANDADTADNNTTYTAAATTAIAEGDDVIKLENLSASFEADKVKAFAVIDADTVLANAITDKAKADIEALQAQWNGYIVAGIITGEGDETMIMTNYHDAINNILADAGIATVDWTANA